MTTEKPVPGWIDYVMRGLPMGMSNLPPTTPCRICGGELDVHQRVTSKVCGRPDCQSRLAEGRLIAAGRNIAARTEGRDGPRPLAYKRAGPVALEAIRRTGADDPNDAVAAVVPFNGLPLAPVPESRRRAFAEHIDAMVSLAFGPEWDEKLEEPEAHFAGRDVIEPDDAPAVGAACIACQGYCCLYGHDTNAFLDASIMALYRHRHPDATEAEVREAYLSRLPEVATESGCIYQGPRGCTLPREMRADICNSYRCAGQLSVIEQLESKPADHVALVSLATWHWDEHEVEEDEPLHRVLTIGPDGEIVLHDDIPLPPLPEPDD